VQQTTPQPLPSKSFPIHFSLEQSSNLLLIHSWLRDPSEPITIFFSVPTPNICVEMGHHTLRPVAVVARSKAWTVFTSSNAGIVGSNPPQDMDVCIVCVYSVFVLFYVQVEALRRADPPSKEPYRLCIGSRKWKSSQGPTKGCKAIIIIIIIILFDERKGLTAIDYRRLPPQLIINHSVQCYAVVDTESAVNWTRDSLTTPKTLCEVDLC
jgi:hypothetical protein